MKKRLILFLLAAALCLCPVLSGAYTLPMATEGQAALARYLDVVNGNLASQKLQPVNSLFECYESFAEMGVTSAGDSETPESVTLTFTLSRDGLNMLLSAAGIFPPSQATRPPVFRLPPLPVQLWRKP